MFAAVPRLWPGVPFVCIGAGPSLCSDDVDAVRTAHAAGRLRVIVVNDAYRLAPWADVLYAADAQWWRWHQAVDESALPQLKFTAQRESREYRPTVIVVNYSQGVGLDLDPSRVRTGGHSGYQAINLAVHLGASAIYLLGYDMRAARDTGGTTRHHFFGEHPNGKHLRYQERLSAYAPLAAALDALNIPIVNCSRQTAIRDLPRGSLAAVLR